MYKRQAWNQVTQKTIANCFRKGGFCHIEGEEENKAAREVVPTTDNWEDVGPVSYTHLDVYKRQVLIIICTSTINITQFCT